MTWRGQLHFNLCFIAFQGKIIRYSRICKVGYFQRSWNVWLTHVKATPGNRCFIHICLKNNFQFITHIWFNPETLQHVSLTFSDCTCSLWAEVGEMNVQVMSSSPQGTLGPHSKPMVRAMSVKGQARLLKWLKGDDSHFHITEYRRRKRHELGWPHFQRAILMNLECLGSHLLAKWSNRTLTEYLPCNCHEFPCQTLHTHTWILPTVYKDFVSL